MKNFISVLASVLLFSGSIVLAEPTVQVNCLDSNLNGIEVGFHFSKLQYLNRFELLYSGVSPAPAGIDPLNIDDHICFATTATYLKHRPSQKTYVMFTTGDDYCDGGNTIGVIIDMDKYVAQQLKGSVVAEIGDGEVVCRK